MPFDDVLPPPFQDKLQILAPPAPPQNRSLEAVPERCTLRLPPDAAFRHGRALGFTVTIRGATGQPIPAPGIPLSINVTGVGDANVGTVYDLSNGTFFAYTTVYYSPAASRRAAGEIAVRLWGRHVAGSPAAVPLDFGPLSEGLPGLHDDYQRRAAAAAAAGHDPALGGEEGCGGEFVIVTGANSPMFDRSVNLVGSVHRWAPGVPVVYYDLGLSAPQAEDVSTWEGVELRKFWFAGYPPHVGLMGENGTYAWRGPILANVSEEFACSLWLDAGLELRADIGVVKGHVAVDGAFLVTNGWNSPNRFTHPACIAHFGLRDDDLIAPGGLSEIEACGGIQGYRRGSALQREVLMGGYVTCLLDPACIHPPGASKKNFRQDQTALNLALAKYRKGLVRGSAEYLISLPHTARKYWEHPVGKYQFPSGDDGTFRPCDKGQVVREGKCITCEAAGMDPYDCDDSDVLMELEGTEYVSDLTIFIRRAFEPKPFADYLRYRLVGTI